MERLVGTSKSKFQVDCVKVICFTVLSMFIILNMARPSIDDTEQERAELVAQGEMAAYRHID